MGGKEKRWSLETLRQAAGDKQVQPKRRVVDSAAWARLEPAEKTQSLSDFLRAVATPAAAGAELEYLFDWPLPVHCPEMLSDLKILSYFSQDLFQRTPEGSLYRDSWPSLFVGPPGSACSLHIDANSTHFWMALFGEGTKEWVLFPADQTPLLHPRWPPLGAAARDAVFEVDPFALWQEQVARFPSLAMATPHRVVLEPGDVLFVPSGWASPGR